jgi:hypothetical protein
MELEYRLAHGRERMTGVVLAGYQNAQLLMKQKREQAVYIACRSSVPFPPSKNILRVNLLTEIRAG